MKFGIFALIFALAFTFGHSAPIEEAPEVRFLSSLEDLIKGLIQQLGNVAVDKLQQIIKDKLGVNLPLDFLNKLIQQAIGGSARVAEEKVAPEVAEERFISGLTDIIKQLISQLGSAAVDKLQQAIKDKLGINLPLDVLNKLIQQAIGGKRETDEEAEARFLETIIKQLIKQLGSIAVDKLQEIIKDKLGVNLPLDVLNKLIQQAIGGKRSVEEQKELIARETSSVISQTLQDLLQKYVDMLKALVAHGQNKYAAILEKAQALLEQLKHHATGILSKVKQFLVDVMQILGANGDVKELEFAAEFMIDSFLDEVAEESVKRMVLKRGLGELIEGLQGTLNQVINALTGHFKDLKDWFKQWLTDSANQLKPHTDNIKQLAQQFLEHINNASDTVKQEALKFFEAHKKDLGALWEQIQQAIQGGN